MKFNKTYSFLLFVALSLGIGIFGTVQTVNAQDKDDKDVEKNHEDKDKKDHDDDDGDDDKYDTPEMQRKLAQKATITKEEAQTIALERVPGTVIESEIDKEKGKVVWEFEIKTAEGKIFEVAVDAKTGEIVLVEDETDEEDDDDDGDTTLSKTKNIFKKTASGITSTTAKVFRKITGN